MNVHELVKDLFVEFEQLIDQSAPDTLLKKPDWWPKNPYPKSIFPMPEEQYPEIVPDPELRTSLSGMLGRQFWDIASDTIWEARLEAIEDGRLTTAAPDCEQHGA